MFGNCLVSEEQTHVHIKGICICVPVMMQSVIQMKDFKAFKPEFLSHSEI